MATERKGNKLLYVNSLRNKDMNNSSYLLPHGEGDQVSMKFKILLYVILSKIAISFFIGFVLEITAFLKTKTLCTSTNYFISSMAFRKSFMSSAYGCYTQWVGCQFLKISLTSVVCKLCSYSLSLSFLVSMPSFLLISADRFAATVYPLKLSTITGRTRTICSWKTRVSLYFRRDQCLVYCVLKVYLFISYLWLELLF